MDDYNYEVFRWNGYKLNGLTQSYERQLYGISTHLLDELDKEDGLTKDGPDIKGNELSIYIRITCKNNFITGVNQGSNSQTTPSYGPFYEEFIS